MVWSLLHLCEMADQVTEPARVGRQYVTQESIEFVKHARCSAGGNLLKLNRQNAMIRLEVMASESPTTLYHAVSRTPKT